MAGKRILAEEYANEIHETLENLMREEKFPTLLPMLIEVPWAKGEDEPPHAIPEVLQPWADVGAIHGLGIGSVAGIPPGCMGLGE